MAETPAPDISLKQVTKRFGETVAVDGISLDIAQGGFFAAGVALRQDDDAAHDRRLRGPDRGAHRAGRARRHPRAALQA